MDNGCRHPYLKGNISSKSAFTKNYLTLRFYSIKLVTPVFYRTGVSGGPTSADLMSQSLGELLFDVSDD